MNIDHIRGLIRENRLTVRKTAEYLKLSEAGFYKKLNGISEFTISEVQKLSELFKVPIAELLENNVD